LTRVTWLRSNYFLKEICNKGDKLDFSKYQQARLIPVTGIKGDLDQERRATSALLAVLVGVPDLAKSLLKPLGAPVGKVETYIEPEFSVGEKRIRPDGLIAIERAGKKWVCLVEVKTGKNLLQAEQLNAYLEIARVEKFDALLTISNEVLTLSGEHPTSGIDARKLRSTKITHYSWIRIITECLLQSEHRGVKDADQAWILKELIRFLQSDASGANEFDDMGANWVPVREGIASGSIASSDKRLTEIVHKYESLMRFVAFKLSARLGVQAQEIAPRLAKDDPKKHAIQATGDFVNSRSLAGTIRVPGAVSDIEVVADLRASQVLCSINVIAPNDGRDLTRVNWLLRQIADAPKNTRIEVHGKRSRQADVVTTLGEALLDPKKLALDQGKEISQFRLVTSTKMGTKRGSGAGSFIGSVTDAVESTYEHTLQKIRPYSSKAPKLSEKVTDLIPETPEQNPYKSLSQGEGSSIEEAQQSFESNLDTQAAGVDVESNGLPRIDSPYQSGF